MTLEPRSKEFWILWTILDAIATVFGVIIATIQLVMDIHKNKKQDSNPPDQG